MSYAEDLFEKALRLTIKPNINIIKNHRPKWLINPETNKILEYDFYIPVLKLAFEIQGPTHYNDKEQIKRDFYKRKLSLLNSITLKRKDIYQLNPFSIRRLLYEIIDDKIERGYQIDKKDILFNKINKKEFINLSLEVKKYRKLLNLERDRIDKFKEYNTLLKNNNLSNDINLCDVNPLDISKSKLFIIKFNKIIEGKKRIPIVDKSGEVTMYWLLYNSSKSIKIKPENSDEIIKLNKNFKNLSRIESGIKLLSI